MLEFHKIDLVKLDFWIGAINLHQDVFFKSLLCGSSIGSIRTLLSFMQVWRMEFCSVRSLLWV